MGIIERYNFTLEKEVVEEAKEQLEVGQKLSPVINSLLKIWIKKRKERKNKNE